MLDAEDRAALIETGLYWGLRAFGAWLLIMGTSVTLGAAWRLFDFLRG